jgi:cyclic-di-GMP-binding biofilm dispersal mediator protein
VTDAIDVNGKVVLVAGGTGGIGRLVSEGLRRRGATVVTASRSDIDVPGHVVVDLRLPDNAQDLVHRVMNEHGRLDVLVNAIGVVAFGDATSTSTDTVEELFLTNTFAHIFLCTAALPNMTKGGVIVGISGVIAEQNLPGMAAYGSSKAAVRSFNEAFGREARRQGVRVIDARPPHTETGLATRAVAGSPPRFPQGLEPARVAERIIDAIVNGETDLSSDSFAK